MSPTDRALHWATVSVQILDTLSALLRGEPFQDWLIAEGQETTADRRYRDTPLYRVWSGELQGDTAIRELVRTLAGLWVNEYEKKVALLRNKAAAARGEMNRGGLYEWNGETYPSALLALGSVADDVVERLSMLMGLKEAANKGWGNQTLIQKEITDRMLWFEENVEQVDLLALLGSVEQELAMIAKSDSANQYRENVHAEPNAVVEAKLTLDERALALFIADSSRSKKAIADLLGVQTQSITPKRCPKLDQAMIAYREANAASRIRGRKDKRGNLEAWDEGE